MLWWLKGLCWHFSEIGYRMRSQKWGSAEWGYLLLVEEMWLTGCQQDQLNPICLLWVKVDVAAYLKAAWPVASRNLISQPPNAVLKVLCFCVGLSQALNKCWIHWVAKKNPTLSLPGLKNPAALSCVTLRAESVSMSELRVLCIWIPVHNGLFRT